MTLTIRRVLPGFTCFVAVCLGLALFPCMSTAQSTTSPDAQIDSLTAQFSRAWSDDDARLSDLLAEDVALIHDEEIVLGRDRVLQWLTTRKQSAKDFVFLADRPTLRERYASQSGEWSLSETAGGASIGAHTFLFKQSDDGVWRFSVLSFQRDVLNVSDIDNHAFATAYGIGLNQPVEDRDTAQPGGDYFTVLIPRAGVFDAVVDPAPPGRIMTVVLYDEQQKQIASATGRTAGRRAAAMARIEPGRYYAFVSGKGSGDADAYTLKLTLDETDVYEINDSFAQAKDIDIGKRVTGAIRVENDFDFYRITVDRQGLYEFALDPAPAALRMNLEVHNERQQFVDRRNGRARSRVNGQAVYLNLELDPGVYYVRTYAMSYRQQGHPDPYQLQVTRK